MFKMPKQRRYDGGAHRITSNRVPVDSGEFYEYLIAGKNADNQYVITAFIDEDEAKRFARYYSVIVSFEAYKGFLSQKVPLLEILTGSQLLFIWDFHQSGKELGAWYGRLEDIPEDARPQAGVFGLGSGE